MTKQMTDKEIAQRFAKIGQAALRRKLGIKTSEQTKTYFTHLSKIAAKKRSAEAQKRREALVNKG